eukprot:gene21649-28662_t
MIAQSCSRIGSRLSAVKSSPVAPRPFGGACSSTLRPILSGGSPAPCTGLAAGLMTIVQRRPSIATCAVDPKDRGASAGITGSFNGAYVAIFAFFGALFIFQNPYIFSALCIVTILPQNSSTTSLNSLVLLFYETGLFMNFAEAVYCVRLVTWLSIACTLISFAIFQ